MNKSLLSVAIAALACPCLLHAQSTQPPGHKPTPPGGDPGQQPAGDHQRPPRNPVMEALDKNRDHVIDKSEIKNAAVSLLSLDKNGDGELSGEEIRPPRPGDSEAKGDGSSMSRSEQRRMEREQRREERQSGNQRQQGSSGQNQQHGPTPPPGQ